MAGNMGKKLNNQGLTLIELVIAIAISTMILGAAFMFIMGAERAYHTAEYGIDLQMEGQILMEQVGNWVMESSKIVIPEEDSDILFLFSIPVDHNNGLAITDYPVDYLPDSTASCRVIFLGRNVAAGNNNRLYMCTINDIANAEDEVKKVMNNTTEDVFSIFGLSAYERDENCIGDFVNSFKATVPDGEDPKTLKSVDVLLQMQEASKGYVLQNTFSMRNGMYNQFKPSEEESTESSSEDTESSSEDTESSSEDT